MKRLVMLLLTIFLFCASYGRTSYLFDRVLVNNTYQEKIYSNTEVIYLLPGQRYVASYNIHFPQIGSGKMSIELINKPEYSNLPLLYNDSSDGFNFNWKDNNSGQESYCQTDVVGNRFESSWSYFNVRADYWLGELSFINDLRPGDSLQYNFEVSCVKYVNEYSCSETNFRTIKSIDRIRGDVNDDGQVDEADVDILINQLGLYQEREYAKGGINLYAACITSSEPDLSSIALIQIWLKDKNDPRVKDLGIGEWMSANQNYPIDDEVVSEESQEYDSKSADISLWSTNSISAYPNPFKERITVVSESVATAMLINSNGQLVKQLRLESGENHFSVGELLPGIFFLKTKEKTIKLIKY